MAYQQKHSSVNKAKLALFSQVLSLVLVISLVGPMCGHITYASGQAKPLLSAGNLLTGADRSANSKQAASNKQQAGAGSGAQSNGSGTQNNGSGTQNNGSGVQPGSGAQVGSDTQRTKPNENAEAQQSNMGNAFMLKAESVKAAFYGSGFNLDLSFVERDPHTGLAASFSSANKKVQSVYLKHNNSADFPFVLTMQEYPGIVSGNGVDWQVSFSGLLVRKDVKSQVYTVDFVVNYTEGASDKLKSEVLTAYVDMQGAPTPKDAQVLFKAVNANVPKGAPGQWVPIKLNLANFGLDRVTILNVTLQMQGSPLVFRQVDQTAIVEQPLLPLTGRYYNEPDFNNGTQIEVDYGTFEISKSAASGTQPIAFEITYLDAMQTLKKETVNAYIEVLGGAGGQKMMPRILVEDFETEPKKIMGGEPFTLTLKLRNTSEMTAVSNMRLNISSQGTEKVETAFLPQSGATAYFIKNIPAGKVVEYKLKLVSAASLNQKAYPLNLGLEYQDDASNSYNTQEQVSLYVHQKVRVDFSKFELQPETAQVGGELNAYCQLINKGRVSLYNAEICAPDDAPYEMEPVYLGNVEAGANKSIDATLKAKQPFSGKSKFVLHYEDENGNASTLEHEFDLNIEDEAPMPEGSMPEGIGDMDNMDGMGGMGQQKKGLSPWLIAIIVILVLILLGVAFFLYRHFKAKKKAKRAKVIGEDY